jgi:hypothetical protein
MCQKGLAEEEEQRGYWFNYLRLMTKVKQTWQKKIISERGEWQQQQGGG